jgi:hypothetical protein
LIVFEEIRLFYLVVLFASISQYSKAQSYHFDMSVFENGRSVFVGLSPENLAYRYDSVFLLVDDRSEAKFYYQNIFTPVCEDNTLCKPVYITLMWDLLGNYLDFRLDRADPLTKINHVPFADEDYEKLHSVLGDDRSILGSYTKETIAELYRVSKGSHSLDEVDAITGATPEYIREQTIEGALYTCHTIWHLCRGKIHIMLLDYTRDRLLNEAFIHQLLASDNIDYLEFALKNLNSFEATKFHDHIIGVIRNSDKIMAGQIIRYLPKELVGDHDFNLRLWELFDQVHFLAQKQILDRFADCQKLPDKVIQELISYAGLAVESQFIQILKTIYNQWEISGNTAELVVRTCEDRRENLTGAAAILLENAAYHHSNKELRDRIIEILQKS